MGDLDSHRTRYRTGGTAVRGVCVCVYNDNQYPVTHAHTSLPTPDASKPTPRSQRPLHAPGRIVPVRREQILKLSLHVCFRNIVHLLALIVCNSLPTGIDLHQPFRPRLSSDDAGQKSVGNLLRRRSSQETLWVRCWFRLLFVGAGIVCWWWRPCPTAV